MVDVTMTMEEYQAFVGLFGSPIPDASEAPAEVPAVSKPKRKVSRYNREFGRQLKALRRKHPKTQTKNLMSKAHSLTRKSLKF